MQTAVFSSLADVRCHELKCIADDTEDLYVRQTGAALPFVVRRVFTVHARGRAERGRHAHKACSQAMACLAGSCEVTIDDGTSRKTFRLDRPTMTLIVPPGIWAEQLYELPGTILMVMCDRDYDASDYIRDYESFLAYRRGAEQN